MQDFIILLLIWWDSTLVYVYYSKKRKKKSLVGGIWLGTSGQPFPPLALCMKCTYCCMCLTVPATGQHHVNGNGTEETAHHKEVKEGNLSVRSPSRRKEKLEKLLEERLREVEEEDGEEKTNEKHASTSGETVSACCGTIYMYVCS